MKQENADAAALSILAWLVAEDELLPVFLGATGVDAADLRQRAGDREFLASVLDFILMDDDWIVSCSNALGVPPEHIQQVRAYLPGGDVPNWT